MTMMIYDMTLQHQAERRMSAAEQRRALRPTRALRGLRASGVTIGG
jgi:hypothetical protein